MTNLRVSVKDGSHLERGELRMNLNFLPRQFEVVFSELKKYQRRSNAQSDL